MKLKTSILLPAVLLLFGCQSPPAAPGAFNPSRSQSGEITPSDAEFEQQRMAARSGKNGRPAATSTAAEGLGEGEILALPKFVVTQKGFIKFGFSVVTNVEVLHGGSIKWMQVGLVIPDSIAARQHLTTGVQIIAIDGWPVTELSREDMLRTLFQAPAGSSVRLLVLSKALGLLPVFVTLAG